MLKLLLLLVSITAYSQSNSISLYDIGNPNLKTVWVDIVRGNDSHSGNSESSAFKTVTRAWNAIQANENLSQGIQINIKSGTYTSTSLPNYWENRFGTYSNPIILNAVDGEGTVTFQNDINAFNLRYFYVIGIKIIRNADAFHCESCDHVLLRKVTLDGGNRQAHETLKVNQSKYFYVENSTISGADDNAIDFVAVQYGHIVNSKISNANDWCAYVKGGSAYITFAGNEVFNCGSGGFTAGQGTGLEYMTSPWIHYEAYDIKAYNNIIHHTEGAGLGVNGGYNISFSHNTLYHVGLRSHLIEVVYGERSCDGINSECLNRNSIGGWGPSNSSIEPQPIPNRNVFIFNNLIYNPTGVRSQWQHFAVYGPRSTQEGSNLSSSVVTDTNLVIRGNVIWNGGSDMPLGIGDDQGCRNDNPTCNSSQLLRDNIINIFEPQLNNPAGLDFRPKSEGYEQLRVLYDLPSFTGGDRQDSPLAAEGNLINSIMLDRGGVARASLNLVGAYTSSSSVITPEVPIPTNNSNIKILNSKISKKVFRRNSKIQFSCTIQSKNPVRRAWIKLGTEIKILTLRNRKYQTTVKVTKLGRIPVYINARDSLGSIKSSYLGILLSKK